MSGLTSGLVHAFSRAPRAILFALLTAAAPLLFASGSAAYAQDPPVPVPTPPPVRIDSIAVRDSLLRVDSIRRAQAQQAQRDSIPMKFPELKTGSPANYASGTWTWDMDALLREGAITVGELLRRVPGMTALRAGGYLQPEAATAFGQTRGRMQVEIDGYVLDPITESSYDLAQVELVNLSALTVERHLDVTRIKLTTAQPVIGKPYTRVEAATGQPDVNAFRAVFLVPKVIVGPLGVALDRTSTTGGGAREPAGVLTGWGKWSWTNGTRGLQAEFRRQNFDRDPVSPWLLNSVRQDVVLRARSQIMTGLTAELYGGQSRVTLESDSGSTTNADSLRVPALERDHWQAGARAAFLRGPVFANATLRMRNADALPSQELEAGAGIDLKLVHAAGDVSQQSWKDGPSALTYDVRAQVGPVSGLGAFLEIADGDRGAPLYADSAGVSIRDEHEVRGRSALRAGATVDRWGVQGGAAYIKLDATSTAPFGLPFDSASIFSLVDPATGVELWGRFGLFSNRFALDASYTYWSKVAGWTYLPTRSWRIAGEMHLNPLPSGNLEVFARLESVYRGSMLAYLPGGVPADTLADQTVPLESNQVLNGYLQIRVLDVRGFIQWEDMLGQGRLDIPDRLINGPRVYYGVKWQLFN